MATPLVQQNVSDLPVGEDPAEIAAFLNRELVPLLKSLRKALNQGLIPSYKTTELPTADQMGATVRAVAFDTTAGALKTWSGSAWV